MTGRPSTSSSSSSLATVVVGPNGSGKSTVLEAVSEVLRADRSTVSLVDDIDRALHPVAQPELIRFLRTTVKARPIQVICTTHSPYVLGEFEYSEVRVLREVEGESRCIALDRSSITVRA